MLNSSANQWLAVAAFRRGRGAAAIGVLLAAGLLAAGITLAYAHQDRLRAVERSLARRDWPAAEAALVRLACGEPALATYLHAHLAAGRAAELPRTDATRAALLRQALTDLQALRGADSLADRGLAAARVNADIETVKLLLADSAGGGTQAVPTDKPGSAREPAATEPTPREGAPSRQPDAAAAEPHADLAQGAVPMPAPGLAWELPPPLAEADARAVLHAARTRLEPLAHPPPIPPTRRRSDDY